MTGYGRRGGCGMKGSPNRHNDEGSLTFTELYDAVAEQLYRIQVH